MRGVRGAPVIVSFVGRDKLVHGAYVSHESTPYILAMAENESDAWCLCAERYQGFVMKEVDALTCIACMIVRLHHGYKWHPMVAG